MRKIDTYKKILSINKLYPNVLQFYNLQWLFRIIYNNYLEKNRS